MKVYREDPELKKAIENLKMFGFLYLGMGYQFNIINFTKADAERSAVFERDGQMFAYLLDSHSSQLSPLKKNVDGSYIFEGLSC